MRPIRCYLIPAIAVCIGVPIVLAVADSVAMMLDGGDAGPLPGSFALPHCPIVQEFERCEGSHSPIPQENCEHTGNRRERFVQVACPPSGETYSDAIPFVRGEPIQQQRRK